MNSKLRAEAKNDFDNDFFKSMNICFWKDNVLKKIQIIRY